MNQANPQEVVKHEFTLVGVHEGKTMRVNGHEFVDGSFSIPCNAQQAQQLTNIFSFYGALPIAEARLAKALAPDAVITPNANAGSPDAVVIPPGDVKPTLGEALALLDPENDSHWTSNNLPGLDDLTALTGEKVTRAEVEAVAEGFTRAKARAVRAG